MSRWFRMYGDVINDPKILRLSEASRWRWISVLCAASMNDGVVPAIADLEIQLRMKRSQVAASLAELAAAGLLDKREDGSLVPHNWEGRQYKSDVSTERVKQHRQRQRNVSPNVSPIVSETPPEQKQNRTEQKDAVADDARPSSGNLTTPESLQLAEKLLVIAGHDPAFWPPGWCGAPARVQTWLNEGWPADIIVSAVTAAARRKTGPPAASVQFFEKAIAEEIGRQAAPLPNVIIKSQETIHVQADRRTIPGPTLSEIAIRDARSGIDFGPRPTGLREPESGAPVRLLSKG